MPQRKRSAHERQKESFESGEWSTGQKFSDDTPKEDVDPDNICLISSGACGAFVHGLEDEFLGGAVIFSLFKNDLETMITNEIGLLANIKYMKEVLFYIREFDSFNLP